MVHKTQHKKLNIELCEPT